MQPQRTLINKGLIKSFHLPNKTLQAGERAQLVEYMLCTWKTHVPSPHHKDPRVLLRSKPSIEEEITAGSAGCGKRESQMLNAGGVLVCDPPYIVWMSLKLINFQIQNVTVAQGFFVSADFSVKTAP